MPNWCYNKLRVSGPKKELAEFREKAVNKYDKEEQLSLQSLYPMPMELIGGSDTNKGWQEMEVEEYLLERFGHSGWYNWRVDHWGTKWDLGEAKLIKETSSSLTYEFETAWTPVNLEEICQLYPNLTFRNRWEEPGVLGKGRDQFKAEEAADITTDREKNFLEIFGWIPPPDYGNQVKQILLLQKKMTDDVLNLPYTGAAEQFDANKRWEATYRADFETDNKALYVLDSYLPVVGFGFLGKDMNGNTTIPEKWFFFTSEKKYIIYSIGKTKLDIQEINKKLIMPGTTTLPNWFNGAIDSGFLGGENEENVEYCYRGRMECGTIQEPFTWVTRKKEITFSQLVDEYNKIGGGKFTLKSTYNRYNGKVELHALLLLTLSQKVAVLWGDTKGEPVGYEWVESLDKALENEGKRRVLPVPLGWQASWERFEGQLRGMIGKQVDL